MKENQGYLFAIAAVLFFAKMVMFCFDPMFTRHGVHIGPWVAVTTTMVIAGILAEKFLLGNEDETSS